MANQPNNQRRTAGPNIIRKIRNIDTAEGVPIKVELADRGDRAGAVLIDLLIIILGIILTTIGFGFMLGSFDFDGLALVVIILSIFFFRNFYFMFFELKWHGRTPGKKKMGIRVVDRFGNPLSAEAIFARNMMREVELFIPMAILLSGADAGVDGLLRLFAFLWAGTLVCLPLFNKDNLRAGDLIAGTLVIKEPKIALLDDIAGSEETRMRTLGAAGGASPDYDFTPEQLAVYGIFELQTLEQLIRDDIPSQNEKRQTAGRTIARKIGWTDPIAPKDMLSFLKAYYNALRQNLEGNLLMGKRKEDKFDDKAKKPK